MNINDYLSRPGAESTTNLAQRLGVNADQLRQWRHAYGGRRPSPDSCAAIEAATRGGVTCEELRPDLRWLRVRDKAWPHPKGRPCIDVASPGTTAKLDVFADAKGMASVAHRSHDASQ